MVTEASIWRDIYLACLNDGHEFAEHMADYGLAQFAKRFDVDSGLKTKYMLEKIKAAEDLNK